MKILLCTSTFQTITHGPAKFAQLVLQINEQYPEHELRILTEEIEEEITNRVYKIQPKYPRLFHAFWPFLNNYSYYKAAMKIREHYPFDILLYNNALKGFWSAVRKPKDLKVVGMVHDDDYLSAGWRTFSFNKKWWINIHRKPLEYLACRKADIVIANSEHIRNLIMKTYHCSKDKVRRLYQTIDISKFEFQKERSIDPQKEIQVLFVKSDYPRGGLKLLIEALALLPYQFRLIIIGPKPSETPIIQSYFKNIKNVKPEIKGPCSQEVVIQYLQQSDIFCVPAHKEGLGIANIEALATGIPVVSTKVGGIPEVLDYGKNGWLTEDRPEALANAFQSCIESPEERVMKSQRGRKFVERHFDYTQMLERLIGLLADR